jgi:hypothetical protein
MLCAALLLYDKLSSLSPSDMSDRSMRHVQGTTLGCIRSIVLDTHPIVPDTQPIVLGIDPEFTGCIDLVPLY